MGVDVWTVTDVLEAMGYDPAEVGDPDTEFDDEIAALQRVIRDMGWTSSPKNFFEAMYSLRTRYSRTWRDAFEDVLRRLEEERQEVLTRRAHTLAVAQAVSAASEYGHCSVPSHAIYSDCMRWTGELGLRAMFTLRKPKPNHGWLGQQPSKCVPESPHTRTPRGRADTPTCRQGDFLHSMRGM